MNPFRRPAVRPADGGPDRPAGLVRRLSTGASATRVHARLRVSRARDLPPDGRTDGQPAAAPSPTGLSRFAGALRTVVRMVRRRVFRHRRSLAPLWALAVMAVLPSIGRVLGLSGRVPLIGGAALTLAACLWVDRGRERRYALAVGAAATIWCWLAWAFDTGWLRLALFVLWLPAAVLWWRHQRVRSRIEVTKYPVRLPRPGEWGSWPPALRSWWEEHSYRRRSRRALRRIWEDWRRTASAAEVPGCRIRRATADRVSYTLHVDLRRGQTHKRMVGHLDELGSALRANIGTLRIELEQRMDRVRIRWVHHDPLAGAAIPWPYADRPEAESVLEPFTLGPNEHGEPVRIRFADGEHTQIVGFTDAGKSGVLNVMIASAAGMRDLVLWGIDPAGGVEFGPWAPVFDRLAEEAGAVAALVSAVERVVQVRLEKLRRAGMRNWEPRWGRTSCSWSTSWPSSRRPGGRGWPGSSSCAGSAGCGWWPPPSIPRWRTRPPACAPSSPGSSAWA